MIITLNTPVKTSSFAGKLLVSSLIRHLFSLIVENSAKIKKPGEVEQQGNAKTNLKTYKTIR